MPDPLNAEGNEQKMPKGNKTYGYTKASKPVKKSNMAYTKTSKPLKPTKGASVNDFDDTVAKYTPYKMKASGHDNSPIEKNYGSKSDRGFGVPFTGGVGSNEMESGVGDKFEGMPYSKKASPTKGLFGAIGNLFGGNKGGGSATHGILGSNAKGMIEKVKAAKLKKQQGAFAAGGGADLEARVSALEEGSSGGGELSTSDPLHGGATAVAGDPNKPLAAQMMKKKNKMQAGWGGVGETQVV
tara:strand:+ start:160 stop:882 length:723 start_codon:yes stop_codon:yes gene_type:complete